MSSGTPIGSLGRIEHRDGWRIVTFRTGRLEWKATWAEGKATPRLSQRLTAFTEAGALRRARRAVAEAQARAQRTTIMEAAHRGQYDLRP